MRKFYITFSDDYHDIPYIVDQIHEFEYVPHELGLSGGKYIGILVRVGETPTTEEILDYLEENNIDSSELDLGAIYA